MAYAKGYNAKHQREGQHRGPITWAFLRVLKAILWGFHNEHTGHCFPSYETIADKAECHRDTVYEAIHALEESGILDWVNRFDKIYRRRLAGHPHQQRLPVPRSSSMRNIVRNL